MTIPKFLLIVVAFIIAAVSNGLAATKGLLSVSASITGKGHCDIQTPNPLNFGSLDAFNPVDRTATVDIVVNCVGIGNSGTTYIIDFWNPAALRTLKHTAPVSPDVIPYDISLPVSGFAGKNNNTYIHTVTGTIRAIDYRLAPIGGYNDSVTLQLLP